MSDRNTRPGRVLAPREREFIRNRLTENKARLEGQIVVTSNRANGGEGMDPRRMGRMNEFLDRNVQEDIRGVREKILRDEKLLSESGPRPITKRERPTIEKRTAENRAWLQAHMCPKSLYYLKQEHPDFARAKSAADQEHSPEYKKRAEQYKQDMRRIDPDNHSASNLETIRPS